MMNIRRGSATLAVVVVLACAAYWAGVSAQQKPAAPAPMSADALLGAALHQEEVAGRLEAAIATYKKLLVAADATRAQKAKAQLRIGACYERLGNSEATKAYEAVVRDYADQTDAARQAREKLAGLAAQGGTGTSRPDQFAMRELAAVLPPYADAYGAPVSPNGRYVAFADPDTGDLAILDLESGAARKLTNVPTARRWTESTAGSVAWSPDSSRVACDWSIADAKRREVRVYALSGGEPQVLLTDDKVSYVPDAWAPDGRILASTLGADESRIVWLTPGASAPQSVKTVPLRAGIGNLRLSPNGAFIVYVDRDAASRKRTLRLMRSDGSGDTALVGVAMADRIVGWTEDAGGIMFVRSESGAHGSDALWLQPIDAGGRAAGGIVMLRDEFPDAAVLGISRTGTLFFTRGAGSTHLYIAPFDPASGTATGRSVRFSKSAESVAWGPAWSPDGTLLAFGSTTGRTPLKTLTVRSIDGKSERQFVLPDGVNNIVSPQWLADGRSVAFNARPRGRDAGIYRVDVNSGQVITMLEPGTQILVSPSSLKEPSSNLGAVSPDGRVAYVRHYRFGADGKQIPALLAHPLDGGASTTLFEGQQGGISEVAVSPDGRRIGFLTTGGAWVVSAQGGDAHIACQAKSFGRGLAWSPDGHSLLSLSQTEAENGGKRVARLARCSVDEGKIGYSELAGIEAEYLYALGVSPDGGHVAFRAASPTKPANVWVLENFLPKGGTR
jgi:Tol biopolymer transport system component